jgi:hypothetical protein
MDTENQTGARPIEGATTLICWRSPHTTKRIDDPQSLVDHHRVLHVLRPQSVATRSQHRRDDQRVVSGTSIAPPPPARSPASPPSRDARSAIPAARTGKCAFPLTTSASEREPDQGEGVRADGGGGGECADGVAAGGV